MAKRPSKPKPKTEAQHVMPPAVWVGATVTNSEAIPARFSYSSKDAANVARSLAQTVYRCVSLNARVCESIRVRMFRAVSPGSKVWRGVKPDRKTMAYLKGDDRRFFVGKAAEYAHQARDIEEVLDHPFLDLWKRPDPFMSAREWRYLRWWLMEACGKAFIYCGEKVGGVPSGLYHMLPQYTRVQGSLSEFIAGYWYGRNPTNEQFFHRDEVQYCRFDINPNNLLDGMSWVHSITLDSDNENAALTAEVARWSNGGQPSMVFEVDPAKVTSLDQLKQIRADFNANMRGVWKSGTPLWLLGAKLAPVQSKPHELGYEKGIEVAQNNIRQAAGIPESMFKMGSASLASAYMADPMYLGQTIAPKVNGQAEEDAEHYLPMYGIEPGEFWLVADNPIGEDVAAIEESSRADVAVGVRTVNEARYLRGLDPLPPELGDVPRFNGVPLQTKEELDAQRQAQADAAAAQSRGEGGAAEDRGSDRGGGDGDDEREPETGGKSAAGVAEPHASDGRVEDKGGSGAVQSARPELNTKDDDDLGPISRRLERLLDAFARDLQAPYRHAFATGVGDAGIVDVAADDERALAAIFRQYVPKILEAAGNDMLTEHGIAPTFDVSANPYAIRFAEEHGARLVTNITDTLRDELRARVATGVQEGQSIAQIQASIQEAAPEFAATRCEVIARTETGFASNEGIRLAARENGFTRKRWIVAGGPCPLCEQIAADNPDAIGIDAVFAGTDVQAPPAHPNCRCLLGVEEVEA
jgi:hypothetical protein